ncbi:hypothetical protein N9059_00675 [bacterium]|nr:hypothetical protein [bacterium]
MNRTLLLVICDFLLLNLLALTKWETAEPTTTEPPAQIEEGKTQEVATGEQDIVDAMKVAFGEEKDRFDQMQAKLDKARKALEDKEEEVVMTAAAKAVREAELLKEMGRKESELLKEKQRDELELELKMSKAEKEFQKQLRERQAELDGKAADLDQQKQSMANMVEDSEKAAVRLRELEVDVAVAEREKELLRRNLNTRMDQELQIRERETAKQQAALEKLELQNMAARELVQDLQLSVKKAEIEKQLVKEGMSQRLEQETEARKLERMQKEKAMASLDDQKQRAQKLLNDLEVTMRVADSEKQLMTDSLTTMKQQVTDIRQEKLQLQATTERLSENVGELAQANRKMTQEVGQLRDDSKVISEQVGLAVRESRNVAGEVAKVAEQSRAVVTEVGALAAKSAMVVKEVGDLTQSSKAIQKDVVQLAMKSEKMVEEIRENRPINLNILFNDFRSNRVDIAVQGVKPTLFRTVTKNTKVSTVVVKSGRNYFGILHIEDTPFELASANRGDKWRSISSTANRKFTEMTVPKMSFLKADPRVMLVPMKESEVEKLGVRAYPTTRNPFKFEDAVLISKSGTYYGETPFRVDPAAPQYVKMNTKFLTRLFGDFSPHTGDLVFSKTGELLGVMVNRRYCVVLNDFRTAVDLDFNDDLDGPSTARKFEDMKYLLDRLPSGVR